MASLALRVGDAVTFLAKLNDARVNAKTYSDAPLPPPALAPIPVTDLPVDDVGKQNLLFRKRAFNLYLTAHRLGDLRRLIRQCGRSASTVFPTGAYNPLGAAAGNVYGPDVNLPIPFEETNNPQYKACIDRNA
ncbi:MAG TPA: hypothetical protein VFS59_00295 [Gemmatimonadaceae bacterium]|nr:hypothetical protein [Gemmatimonadaceae bacterium]